MFNSGYLISRSASIPYQNILLVLHSNRSDPSIRDRPTSFSLCCERLTSHNWVFANDIEPTPKTIQRREGGGGCFEKKMPFS